MFGGNFNQDDFSGSQVGAGYLNSPGIANQNSNVSGTKGATRSNDSCLVPVTIKQITSALEPEPDALFMIDGKDSFNVTVIGAITHIEVQSTNTAVTVTDGTDEIAVKIWASEEGRVNTELEKMKDLQKGAYVKIFGRPQLYRGTRSITCYRLDVIKDSNEITLHLVEALYAHLMNTTVSAHLKTQLNSNAVMDTTSTVNTVSANNNGNYRVKANTDVTNASMRNTNPLNGNNVGLSGSNALRNNTNSHLSGGIFSTGDVDIEESEMTDLEKKIMAVIKSPMYSSTDGGCHIDEVFRNLKDVHINDIKEAILRLSDDGQLYSTIDEEHYKPTH